LASAAQRLKGREYLVSTTVKNLSKRFNRTVTTNEIVQKLGWKKSLVYKYLKVASKKRLIGYEPGTREKNVKRIRPLENGPQTFLPSPHSVLKRCPEIGEKVKYFDPITGKRKVVRR